MPKKGQLKCYFGCAIDGPLHKFPSWEYPHEERFNQWKSVLDSETQEKGNNYIYHSLRLRGRHFEKYYKSQHSSLLTRNAVPTLNLAFASQVTNIEQHQENPNTCTSVNREISIPSNSPIIEQHIEVLNTNSVNQEIIQTPEIQEKTAQVIRETREKPSTSSLNQNLHNLEKVYSVAQSSMEPPNPKIDNQQQHPSTSSTKQVLSIAPISPNSTIPTEQARSPSQPQRSKKRVIGSKCSNGQAHLETTYTVAKLVEKIDKLRIKYKKQKQQILAAKKLSISKSFLITLENLPDPIRLFTEMQIKFFKKPRGRRFTNEEKIMALTIYKQGPKVYKLLQKLFVLPSKRCLQNLLSTVSFKPGINKHVLQDLKEVVRKMPEEKKIVNLLFDEVALAPGVTYNSQFDEITGFEDGGDKKNKRLADHALVYMIKGIKGKTKQPVCFTFCQSSTKKEYLKKLTVQLIRDLRATGLKVICTICDQHATNVSVIKSLQEDTRIKYLREGKEYNSKAFEIDDIKVYPLFDTPHLLKGVRNNLLIKNAKFLQNNKIKYAKWEHLELLLNIDEGEDELRLVNKLTENHIRKEKIPKMKVKFAAQVFSQRVSAAMRFLAKRNILPAECEDTADFLLIFDKLFDSFNGHSYKNDSKIYKSCVKTNSLHFQLWNELLPILESIKFQSIIKRNGIEVIKHESIPSIKNWIHNIKCFIELWHDLKTNYDVKNLITRNFNQDPLENFFSCIRSNGVRNTNPNCCQFTNAYKTLIINNYNSPHSPGANCEIDDNQCMQSLKNLISRNYDDSTPNFSCDIDLLCDAVTEIRNSNSLVHVESKKYVTGYLIKKCKTKIFKTCEICKRDLCRSEVDVDSFNYEVDYTKRSLFHPSDQFNTLMNDIYYMIVACLREFPQLNCLKQRITFFIDCACDFSMITCDQHKADLIDQIKNTSMNIIINSWCNGVNRILNGKFLKYDEGDDVKKEAFRFYSKRKK